MYYKKNLSIYDSTFPFVWVCVLTWWIDRLFVELGHRSTDTLVCTHNNLQYIHYHQYVTSALVCMQIVKAIAKRRREFTRESNLATSVTNRCALIIIALLQSVLVLAWCSIVLSLLDVSPWLCVGYVLENRALLSFGSLLCILCVLPVETILWDWFIVKGLPMI